MNPILLTHSDEQPLLRMDLTRQVGEEVEQMFMDAANKLEQETEEFITFDAGYQLQEGELFEISAFELPEGLIQACEQPLSVTRLEADALANLQIKSIVGCVSTNPGRLYFQNFDSRRVLIPGRRLAVLQVADRSTFRELQEPVMLLDGPLAAIWDNGSLRFKSFHLVKQIFDLSGFFSAATDSQVQQFVDHQRFCYDDRARLQGVQSAWSRKKIALILRGGVLDQMTVDAIIQAGEVVDYEVPIKNNKILLPEDKGEFKGLLQFLDEDIYRGPISNRRLLSSGKREV